MKIPKPKKLPSGNFNIRLRLGGEEISITRLTDTECIKEARIVKAEYLAGRRVTVSREVKELTLEEIQTAYLKKNKPVLSPATIRSYESYVKNRWKKYSGRRLMDIRFQDMINEELEKASPKTVKNAWALVSASMKASGYPVPNVNLAKVPVKDAEILQPDEILRFCDALKGKPYEIAALLMLHGLRLSEVKGMRWKDADLKNGVLMIRGAEVRGPAGMVRKDTNKNETSTRSVPILAPHLKKAIQAEIDAGAAEDPDGQIVKTNPSNLLEDVKRACRAAGVTVVTCHGLRKSFASLGYFAGVSERQIMTWGGWKDYKTMHAVYIKLAAISEQESKKKMAGFFQEKKAKSRYKLIKGNLKPNKHNADGKDDEIEKARK